MFGARWCEPAIASTGGLVVCEDTKGIKIDVVDGTSYFVGISLGSAPWLGQYLVMPQRPIHDTYLVLAGRRFQDCYLALSYLALVIFGRKSAREVLPSVQVLYSSM